MVRVYGAPKPKTPTPKNSEAARREVLVAVRTMSKRKSCQRWALGHWAAFTRTSLKGGF